jgi:hypothetical protein
MRAIVTILCIPIAAALGVCLALERAASLKLNEENNGLRQQLSQMDQLSAENRRLSNLLAQPIGPLSGPNQAVESFLVTDEPAQELVRLRGEVKVLQQQNNELQRLQADTGEARAAAQAALKTKRDSAGDSVIAANGSGLELLSANYWTATTNLDVRAELSARIRGHSLRAMASNNLKGDPEFGQTKHLTVVYRFGGVIMTNEFREGDVVILPREQEQ